MEITKETVRELRHGHTVVGTTAVQLTAEGLSAYKGVLLRAPGSSDPAGGNTAPIWIGGRGVTANSGSSGGMPIVPGNSVFIPIDKPDLLWLISTSADQDIAWMLL